jgi:DNA-binding response OmpR family regulator
LSSQTPETPTATTPHVLVVEDDESVGHALSILIETTGARVTVGGSIAETLAIGLGDPARLVLLDLTLPDGDGLAVVEPLRAAGSRQFVALTGHDDPVIVERCRAAGCSDVLLKPVPARELLAKVRGWLAD